MNEEEHNWLLNTILALMDSVWAAGGSSFPVANHFDPESNWHLLEVGSAAEARGLLEKMGFVRTSDDTYCHPEELAVIERTLKEIKEKRTNPTNATITPATSL